MRACIEQNGTIPFQNTTGVTVDNFLTLLEFYLRSTFILFDKGLYRQRRGICIGSCIAPVLCNIFQASVDRQLADAFKLHDGLHILKLFRYVDDFLIVFSRLGSAECYGNVLNMFRLHGKGLNFTHELPLRNSLQFLDLCITFHDSHVCWQY